MKTEAIERSYAQAVWNGFRHAREILRVLRPEAKGFCLMKIRIDGYYFILVSGKRQSRALSHEEYGLVHQYTSLLWKAVCRGVTCIDSVRFNLDEETITFVVDEQNKKTSRTFHM